MVIGSALACACSGDPYDAHIAIAVDGRPNIDPTTVPIPGSIAGLVKDNLNVPVPGVTVTLFYLNEDNVDIEVSSVVTDAAGHYEFLDVGPCDYVLQFIPPAAFDIGGAGVDPTTGRTPEFALNSGQNLRASRCHARACGHIGVLLRASILHGQRKGGTIDLVVVRSPTNNLTAVVYTVIGGTATNGLDYLAPLDRGLLIFAPGIRARGLQFQFFRTILLKATKP